jgi:predicted Zn-ribbon and HTH transcriptional regulator
MRHRITLFDLIYNTIKIKDAGLGGLLIGIGAVIFSGAVFGFMRSRFAFGGAAAGIGAVLIIVGFIIMPGKPDTTVADMQKAQREMREEQEEREAFAAANPVCPDCGSRLIFDEVMQAHNCPYCHVEVKVD